ncbi:ComC/BlpC family leader-containing pheromone/bacteriocin [Chitinophaga pendula]|uniref:ComC/BlpC family leader-containing pheromone/bacteriocin n=1 Tax=Chitinophaga TaxID=79328 RepID=UPI000BB0152F|nr:hypothetical protein CK934_24350 [Chitinophaga sp. MD30]UCJ08516.1 ComC/BlpC family leader-containing pheromone/bacteriocin [Chitinophaga pendula]
MKKITQFKTLTRTDLKIVKGGGLTRGQIECPKQRCITEFGWPNCLPGVFCGCMKDLMCGSPF